MINVVHRVASGEQAFFIKAYHMTLCLGVK